MTDLDREFIQTVERLKTQPVGKSISNELKLQLYALYKQATQGDISGSKPGAFDLIGRAKYSAWEKLTGISTEDAKKAYLKLIDEFEAS